MSIGEEAFRSCTGLTSITIPNSVTSIGHSAFYDCTGLTSITIPNSVTSIGESTFENCSGLTSITIPNSVTSIGESTFAYCSGLTSITIPNSVTNISKGAFRYCSGLASVTIPESVRNIGDYAFDGCSMLTSVTILNPIPVVITNGYTFNNRENATLYVPQGSKEAYQKANYWKGFKKIKEGLPIFHKLIYIVDGEKYKFYEIAEDESITPEPAPKKEGYTFSGWSEIPATMPAKDVTVTGTFTIVNGINQLMSNEKRNIKIFTLDGKRVNKPKKGYNIIDGKKVFVR